MSVQRGRAGLDIGCSLRGTAGYFRNQACASRFTDRTADPLVPLPPATGYPPHQRPAPKSDPRLCPKTNRRLAGHLAHQTHDRKFF